MEIAKKIHIPYELHLKTLHEALKEIHSSSCIGMVLPSSLMGRGGLGLEGELIQIIATWLRHSETRDLSLCLRAMDLDDRSSFLYDTFAARMSEKISLLDQDVITKNYFLKDAYNKYRSLLNLDFESAARDGYLIIPCFSAKLSNKEFNSPLYENGRLIEKDRFFDLMKSVLNTVVKEKGCLDFINRYINDICSIVYELFENTHKHGRFDIYGNRIVENCRAIIFNFQKVDLDFMSRQAGGGITLEPRFHVFAMNSSAWIEKNQRKLPILDITILDCGAGFASNTTKRQVEDLTEVEEINAVKSCFNKYRTSSSNSAAGGGLTDVLIMLQRLMGRMRLRTGRLTMGKSFYDSGDPENFTEADFNYHREGAVIGSSINISIPLVNLEADHV